MTRMRCVQRGFFTATALSLLLGVLSADARSEAPPSAESADKGAAIKSILPHGKEGEEACFVGTFAGRTLDMEDWAHTRIEHIPGLEIGGKPATRPVPGALPDQEVSRIALHLTYREKGESSFDYLFTVMAASRSLGRELFARSGCAWGERPDQLVCFIECDGGSMTAERIAGTESLDLSFADLSMQAGCDGGGAYRIGTGDRAGKVGFSLEKAPLRVCEPLRAWARDN